MASSKKTTASLFNNMSSLAKSEEEKAEPVKDEISEKVIAKNPSKPEEPQLAQLEKPQEKDIAKNDKLSENIDKINTGKKTVSFTTPGEIKDKLQRYSIAFPDSISQYITDLIIKDFNENGEKYEEIATLLEKVKGLR